MKKTICVALFYLLSLSSFSNEKSENILSGILKDDEFKLKSYETGAVINRNLNNNFNTGLGVEYGDFKNEGKEDKLNFPIYGFLKYNFVESKKYSPYLKAHFGYLMDFGEGSEDRKNIFGEKIGYSGIQVGASLGIESKSGVFSEVSLKQENHNVQGKEGYSKNNSFDTSRVGLDVGYKFGK